MALGQSPKEGQHSKGRRAEQMEREDWEGESVTFELGRAFLRGHDQNQQVLVKRLNKIKMEKHPLH